MPPSNPMTLLFRGASLVAFDKPSGMAVHRGWADDGAETALVAARRLVGAHVFPVHRLDRATSGVLVFALSSEAAAVIQRAFEGGLVEKTYLALVRGTPPPAGRIDHPVPRTKEHPEDRVPAVTDFETLGSASAPGLGRTFSLVLARPRTGRQHQIRRHFKHLSHPLVGDANYGKGELNRHFRDVYGLSRLALHALHLRLPSPEPVGGELHLTAPLPADLLGALEMLGLSGVYRTALSPGAPPCEVPSSEP